MHRPTSQAFQGAKLQQGLLPSFSGFILLGGWPRHSKRNRKTGPHPEPRLHVLEPGACAPPPPHFLSTRWRWRPVFVTVLWAWRLKSNRRNDVERWKFMKVNPFTILALHASWQALEQKVHPNEWKYTTCAFIYDTANLSTHSFQTSTSWHFCV